MFLDELFKDTPHIEIEQLSIDSRVPMKNCIFFCIAGIKYNGHDYIKEAIKNGANVIVYSQDIDTSDNAIFIKVNDTADCLNQIAPKFFDYPLSKLETYVCSGCDGLPNVSYLIKKMIGNFKSSASIGVNGIYYGDNHLLSKVPTLPIIDTFRYLDTFVKNGVEAVVLESDPLAFSYKKLDGIKPDCFIYTNTNEYSTYYQEKYLNYFKVLRSYLYTLDDDTIFVLNKDDVSYNELIDATGSKTYSYGFDTESDFVIKNLKQSASGTSFTLLYNNVETIFKTALVGTKNLYSVVATLVALSLNGYELSELSLILSFVKFIEGEMQKVIEPSEYNIFIDSASNPDTILQDYKFARSILKRGKKIVALLGINGGDEKENIKEIARESYEMVDRVILTENNSLNNNVDLILNNCSYLFKGNKPLLIEDRKIAIQSAIDLLNSDDILLILGKGKEQFLIRNLGRESYEGDYVIATEYIKEINKTKEEVYD